MSFDAFERGRREGFAAGFKAGTSLARDLLEKADALLRVYERTGDHDHVHYDVSGPGDCHACKLRVEIIWARKEIDRRIVIHTHEEK